MGDRCVALLTDFGASEYVGVLKGVVLSRAPDARLVDLVHDVTPQAVREGAWLLLQSYRWFPRGTVFLCVVDPGVGTERAAVAAATDTGYFFVGPDNGLMAPALDAAGLSTAVSLPTPATAARTFHGRDVFAPAAADLAAGASLLEMGAPRDRLASLTFVRDGRRGEIVRIDRFGNCITNLPAILDQSQYDVEIEAGNLPRLLRFYRTYAQAPDDALSLVENAYGTLEIVCKNGSAQERVKTRLGSRVRLA